MKKLLRTVAATAFLIAPAANASTFEVDFNFNQGGGAVDQAFFSVMGADLTVRAGFVEESGNIRVGQRQVVLTTGGLGVLGPDELIDPVDDDDPFFDDDFDDFEFDDEPFEGPDSINVDGDGFSEILTFDFGESRVRLNSVSFTFVDDDDEFRFFEDVDGFGQLIGFGPDVPFIGGQLTIPFSNTFTFTPGSTLASSLFGIGAIEGGDDFRVGSINVTVLPEPSTWLMMILGFGMAGLVLQRRRKYADA
jgi:hypothetical protein